MWLLPQSLLELTDPATHARGVQLFRAQHVLGLDVKPAGPDQWDLIGHVQGTQRQPYNLEVQLSLMPDGRTVDRWRSLCTCPVGMQCKHAVALLLKAAYLPQAPASAAEQAMTDQERHLQAQERQRQQAQAEQQRQRQLLFQAAERWLLAPTGPVHSPPRPRATGMGRATAPDVPIYMLAWQPNDGKQARLCLFLAASTAKLKGGWSKPRAVGAKHFDTEHTYSYREFHVTPQDQEVLDLLGALPVRHGRGSYVTSTDWLLDGMVAPMVLARAATTGRLFWRLDNGAIGDAITWGPALALQWQWTEQPGPSPDEPLWQLSPQLPEPHALLCANRPHMFYINHNMGHCGPVLDASGAGAELLKAPPLPQALMQQHQAELVQRLGDAVPLPPSLPSLVRVGGKPVWCLHLSRVTPELGSDELGLLTAQVDFNYQGHSSWWPMGSPLTTVLERAGQQVLLTREPASEQQAIDALHGLGLREWAEGVFVLPAGAAQTRWLTWAEQQFQPLKDAGFDVTVEADLHHWVRVGGELVADVTPESEGDTSPWFELSLGLEVDGQRINVLPWLPQLIASLREHADAHATRTGTDASAEPDTGPALPAHLYLPAPGGNGFVRVATAPLKPWLDALLELFDDHRFDGEHVRLSRFDALRTRVALGEGAHWQGADQLQRMAQQLQGRADIPTVPKPQGLHADMRPYQQQGLDWLQFLREHGLAGILADDMGLGKTLQTLAHIQVEKEAGRLDRPVLVVAPVSLLGNWQRETTRFCPGLTTVVLHGAERHGRADDVASADVVIAPYSLLHRDRERWLQQRWHLVVLDEAQNIKNATTQAAQVVAELDTRHRLCLSGTPIENHLGEIWSLFHFLMPGFLGSQPRFAKRFRTPIEKHGDGQRLAQLRARLTPFILRRTKQVVAHELPPKVESVMAVELVGKQADLYEAIRLSMEKAVRDAIADKGLARSQIVFLDALLKLRQVCCDPRLVKTAAAAKVKTSAKLEQLMEMLPEMLAEGRRVLLFSQFTSMLSLIEDELKKHKIAWVKLTGQTQKRDEVIDRFTRGEVPLFLISLKAGGVGLNLPQADTVIHFDPWWNPAAENQATDRAHRIGQTQSVWVVKLVAQGTIEERILALQARKAELARELYSGSTGRKQPLFTAEDVQALLKPI